MRRDNRVSDVVVHSESNQPLAQRSFYSKLSNFRVADLGATRHYFDNTYFDEYECTNSLFSSRVGEPASRSADNSLSASSGGSSQVESVISSSVLNPREGAPSQRQKIAPNNFQSAGGGTLTMRTIWTRIRIFLRPRSCFYNPDTGAPYALEINELN